MVKYEAAALKPLLFAFLGMLSYLCFKKQEIIFIIFRTARHSIIRNLGKKIRGNASFSGAEPPGTITSTISIRDMLRDVKNVASKLYINADGSENFMFHQSAV